MTDQQPEKNEASDIFSSLSRLQKAMHRLNAAWEKHTVLQAEKKAQLVKDIRRLITDYNDTLHNLSLKDVQKGNTD